MCCPKQVPQPWFLLLEDAEAERGALQWLLQSQPPRLSRGQTLQAWCYHRFDGESKRVVITGLKGTMVYKLVL